MKCSASFSADHSHGGHVCSWEASWLLAGLHSLSSLSECLSAPFSFHLLFSFTRLSFCLNTFPLWSLSSSVTVSVSSHSQLSSARRLYFSRVRTETFSRSSFSFFHCNLLTYLQTKDMLMTMIELCILLSFVMVV